MVTKITYILEVYIVVTIKISLKRRCFCRAKLIDVGTDNKRGDLNKYRSRNLGISISAYMGK